MFTKSMRRGTLNVRYSVCDFMRFSQMLSRLPKQGEYYDSNP